MSHSAGSKGDDKQDKKRKRESVDSDRGRPKKRGSNRSYEEQDLKDEASKKLKRSRNSGGLNTQSRSYTERPETKGKKRQIEEEEAKDKKKIKSDENEAGTPTRVIAPLGLSDFQFHQELGQGAFGKVVLASLKINNITVAIKAIPTVKKNIIQKEKRVLLRVSGNPYLCHPYAGFQVNSHAFIVMEHLSGGNLEEMLGAKGALDIRTTVLCSAEMICGIQHLHELGVIHRDLKTANVLIDHQGHIRICDFGLAAENVFGAKTIFGGCGTLLYMAPEMLKYDPYGSAVDWWALGVIIFRLLTNTYPFGKLESRYALIHNIIWDEPTYPESLSNEAKDIIQRFLCKERHGRLGWRGNVQRHPFYDGIDWQKVKDKTNDPPFLPKLTKKSDSASSQPLNLPFLQVPEGDTHPADGKRIPGFSFVQPDWSF